MLRRFFCLSILMLALAACDEVPVGSNPPTASIETASGGPSGREAARSFVEVTRKMEPLLERECRNLRPGANCDFHIVVDDRPDQAPNAFQTLDGNGRPVIAFTLSLIADARNKDELAFILSHEAAHHIKSHIPRQQKSALEGQVLLTGLAVLLGGDDSAVREAQRLGSVVGARRFSKEFELEADELGTILTIQGGYDPLVGAQFFNRIPDPGNRFLGTHPPNAQRLAIVRKTAAAN